MTIIIKDKEKYIQLSQLKDIDKKLLSYFDNPIAVLGHGVYKNTERLKHLKIEKEILK